MGAGELLAMMLIVSLFVELAESSHEAALHSSLLLLVFPAALFVTSGFWIRVFILLCFLTLVCIMIKLADDKVKFCAQSALWSSLVFGSNIVGMIRNYTFDIDFSGSPGLL